VHRLAITGLVLVVAGISIAVLLPESDVFRVCGLAASLGGVALLFGLLVYRIAYEGKGENLVSEIVENVDERYSQTSALSNNALEPSVNHCGPRLPAARSLWPAAQLGR
jgi:hypothetical protein